MKTLDIADLFKMKAVGKVPRPRLLTRLTLKIAADDKLDGIPSDDHQTASKTSDGWTVDVHPPDFDENSSLTIGEAWKMQPDWVKPDARILCDSPHIVSLAREIVGAETNALKAAHKIQQYVAKYMTYDEKAIGVRNSNDIYESKHGVCVDFAILTAALMRAASIPARLAAGVVSPEDSFGSFYSHEWIEVFDGSKWVGVETTSPDSPQVIASYIKFGSGSSEQIANSSEPRSHHAVLTILSVN